MANGIDIGSVHSSGSQSGSGGPLPEKLSRSSRENDAHEGLVDPPQDGELKRHLGNRQIQMIAIGGSIGTNLFVSIGNGLIAGGPANLLMAWSFYAILLGCVNNGIAEMCVYMPVAASFIRFAGRWVDPALGFMAGWNFFLYEAILIPYEISALGLVLEFWRDDIPIAAVCVACIILFGLLNVFAVQYFGEAEFWLAGGKLVLLIIVFAFTFITMVGGNPQHKAYGFYHWYDPGAFATPAKFRPASSPPLGHFQGFLGSLWSAAFSIVGPEYIAMVAGESKRPRVYLKKAFKTVYWRFGLFYFVSALACGIVIGYDNPKLGSGAGANGSPYVIAMQDMGITILPDIANALILTSIFSAGNAYTYCATRSLYGLAISGHAPKFLRRCTKNGVPWVCFLVTMCFPFLSFLSVNSSSAQAVTWLLSLTEGAGMLDYVVMAITYIFFHRATKAQGIDRKTLPYCGWFQPWCAVIGLVGIGAVELAYGYAALVPGHWDIGYFFSHYTMLFIGILTFSSYKLIMRTKFVHPAEADLVWDKPIIDAYENSFTTPPTKFRHELLELVGLRKKSKNDEELTPASAQDSHEK